ncbi:gamma-glutamylcyclotransferase family protein [Methanothermococcus okinawensis]|uniref:Putative gamma-glutamylcyclotransferase n=1 Tax=Methanothermococcus okinawensis (strain DSM 14208 / JCM 11175 / IH1) TaxID=647113 RepID=F8ALF6_METOI|nr:gamma-glutamylcyclotransferase family protein [Methanothermococcus okinawensis]AEH06545.1 AIG2 family protein [Methanothermococcus okinawensis IH1]
MNVFAYGELMKKDRLKELINRVPKMKKGKIIGYEKFFDKNIGYYGVKEEIKEKRKTVDGIILFDISEDELKIFDDYEDEGVYYLRRKTHAYDDEGNKYEVCVYIRN